MGCVLLRGRIATARGVNQLMTHEQRRKMMKITDLVPPSATLPSSPNPHAEFYWGYGQVYGFSGVILFYLLFFWFNFWLF